MQVIRNCSPPPLPFFLGLKGACFLFLQTSHPLTGSLTGYSTREFPLRALGSLVFTAVADLTHQLALSQYPQQKSGFSFWVISATAEKWAESCLSGAALSKPHTMWADPTLTATPCAQGEHLPGSAHYVQSAVNGVLMQRDGILNN